MFSKIRAHQYVALRLPNDSVKIEQVLPNTTISLGKYGTFHTNNIIGRPYNLTFEIVEKTDQQDGRELRIIRASEIHAETLLEEEEPADLAVEETSTSTPAAPATANYDEYNLPNTTDKSNVNITDNPLNQKLTYRDIELLKSGKNSREVINEIMKNHSQLDQKTAFSLAKYTLRKQKKYMKRFTVLPVDISTLTDWMMNDKDFSKILEMRNETLGFVGSWANVHAAGPVKEGDEPSCRYLVVDDTGGLLVAALAERIGILHHNPPEDTEASTTQQAPPQQSEDPSMTTQPKPQSQRRVHHEHKPSLSNSLTLIHANQQPNLSLLRYFSFDPTQTPSPTLPPSTVHPLHTHLHTLSWLQLLHPHRDTTYSTPPPTLAPSELSALKPNARSNYHRKRRRYERTKWVVDQARQGGFDGLVVAGYMDPVSVLRHLVPLVKGGGMVVVYCPQVEGVMEVCDVYSTARRAAYLREVVRRKELAMQSIDATPTDGATGDGAEQDGEEVKVEDMHDVVAEDGDGKETMVTETDQPDLQQQGAGIEGDPRFPVNPTLLLTPTVHHSVARPWQVLPGRTHPLMMGKGGAEGGYVMVSTRVIPVEGTVVQARGRQGKRAKKRADDGDRKQEQQTGESAKRAKLEM